MISTSTSVAPSLPSSRISIPPELVYHILEHIQDNDTILLNCAFVSRSWASVAQRHLFSSITVQGPDNRDLSSFLRHLLEFPSIGHYVEHLNIHNGTCGLSELLAVVSKLTNLRTLMVEEGMSVTALDSASSPALLTRNLDILKVKSSTINHTDNLTSWSPLFDFINTFSAVGNLELEHLWRSNLHDAISLPFLRKTRVRTLAFFPTLSQAEAFVEQVVKFLDVENLASLAIMPIDCGNHAGPLQTLIDAATGLKECVIDVEASWGYHTLQQLSRFPCKSLETLRFSHSLVQIHHDSDSDMDDFHVRWAPFTRSDILTLPTVPTFRSPV